MTYDQTPAPVPVDREAIWAKVKRRLLLGPLASVTVKAQELAATLAEADADKAALAAMTKRMEEAEEAMAEAYQAVGVLIHHFGLSDNSDCIRILDVLAYDGKTVDGVELLPWPKEPLPSEHDALRARTRELEAENAELREALQELIARIGDGTAKAEIVRIAAALVENMEGGDVE